MPHEAFWPNVLSRHLRGKDIATAYPTKVARSRRVPTRQQLPIRSVSVSSASRPYEASTDQPGQQHTSEDDVVVDAQSLSEDSEDEQLADEAEQSYAAAAYAPIDHSRRLSDGATDTDTSLYTASVAYL